MNTMVSLPIILSLSGLFFPTPCIHLPHSLESERVQIAESLPRRRESKVSNFLPVTGFNILPATVGSCCADWARRVVVGILR